MKLWTFPAFQKPVLKSEGIYAGEMDTLVPPKEAKDIFKHLGTDKKELHIIPSANHNDIMLVGFQKYFDAIERFIEMTEVRESG